MNVPMTVAFTPSCSSFARTASGSGVAIMRAPDTMKTFVNGVLLIAALILDVALEKRNRKRM